MNKYISLLFRIVVAVILVQTLRFKFAAHPDSIYIFEKVGLGAPGRIGTGIAELIAAILILIPRTVWLGSLMTVGIIGGAILFHLTILGIEINGDGGTVFYLALVSFILSLILLWNERKKIPIIGKKF
ncbi:DoxX family protein [Aureivirga sp. CE67]|uniref:DoxX family protein n=1 Tax=Aureivirga sp. CE67 TaxID=1788983 RepID=UPI0018CA4041|nr:DoxX family protein [Aureivirga sp. CE67]